MFNLGAYIKSKSIEEFDLYAAYEKSIEYARAHSPTTAEMLRKLSFLVINNTGQRVQTALGDFSSERAKKSSCYIP